MADPYEQFMAGVPDVRSSGGRSVFQNSPMSSRSRQMLSANRLAATGAILETRDRMEQFRASQRARIQAPAAMGALSQLNPATDPDYDVKTAGIFAQYPDAATDETVQNFLGVQGGIFDRVSKEREMDRRTKESWEIYQQKQNEAIVVADIRAQNTQRREKEESLDEKWGKLPAEYQAEVTDLINERGIDPEQAIKKGAESYDSEKEMNELYALGFDEVDIMGDSEITDPDGNPPPGILGADGRIDPTKKAKLLGGLVSEKQAESAAAKRRAEQERRISWLARRRDKAEGEGDEFSKAHYQKQIDAIDAELGRGMGAPEDIKIQIGNSGDSAIGMGGGALPGGVNIVGSDTPTETAIPSKVGNLLKRGSALAK